MVINTQSGRGNVIDNSGFGVGVSSVNTKAIMEVSSSSQGILVPRLTTTQINGITTPPSSLMAYNSDTNKYMYYNVNKWVNVSQEGIVLSSQVIAYEPLNAGDFVNVFYDVISAASRVQKSSALNQHPANGFVLANVSVAALADVYFFGSINSQVSTALSGYSYYLHATTNGLVQTTPVTGSGLMSQCVGVCVTNGQVLFNPSEPVILA